MESLAILALVVGLAFAPALIYLLLLWWLDRYEKEPLQLFILAFVWGAIPSIFLGIIFELILGLPLRDSGPIGDITEASIIAPIVEESVKGALVLVLFLAYRAEFDDVLDGIIYGAVVGLGFSTVENILYGFSALSEVGIGGAVTLWFLRSGIFGLNHAFFTSITGAALGATRYTRNRGTRILVPILGLIGAISFHALHNTLVSVGGALDDENLAVGGCLVSIIASWGGVLTILILAILSINKERGWIEQELWEEVSVGRFTPDEYHMLTSSWRRWSARWRQLSARGVRGFRMMGHLQQLASELAFHKHQINVEHDTAWTPYDIQVLRARIDDLHQKMAT